MKTAQSTVFWIITLLIVFSVGCQADPSFSSGWVSKDLATLTFSANEVVITENTISRTFPYAIKDGQLQIMYAQDTAIFQFKQTNDSLFLELLAVNPSKHRNLFEYLGGQQFVRLSSWNGQTNWDSVLVERHYWINQKKTSQAEKIVLYPNGHAQIQSVLKEHLKPGTTIHTCKVRDEIKEQLSAELSRITPTTFHLWQGPAEDALLMNTVTLYSSSGVDTFSGFDVPMAYPLLHDLLSRMPEILHCEK